MAGSSHGTPFKMKGSPYKHKVKVGTEKGTTAGSAKGAKVHNDAHDSGHFIDMKHNTKTSGKKS